MRTPTRSIMATITSLVVWLAVIYAGLLPAAPPETQANADRTRELNAQIGRIESLRERGDYAKAIDAAKSLLAATEKSFGPDDPWRVVGKRALASAYLEIGDRDKARPLLREALAALEKAEPRDVAAIASVLGDLADTVHDSAEAESLFRQSLELAEQAHGPEHSATALALNNVAAFLRLHGHSEEAESLMRRALHIRERTEGMASPLTAQSLCTLGAIAADRGDITAGEALVRASLDRRRADLPRGHSDIAESCLELARILLVFHDRADEAALLASEALGTYRTVFGPTNNQTLLAMHTKADALAAQGRRAESERLHEELIAKIESLPAADMDALAKALCDYGKHMLDAGKPERAIALCRRAITVREKVHEPDDDGIIAMRQVLADALHAHAKAEDAVTEGRAVVAALERRGEERQQDADVARFVLAKYLLAAGDMEEARSLLRQSIDAFGKSSGPGNVRTLQAIHVLAMTYLVTDELTEAERLVDDGLDRFAAAKDVRAGGVARDLIGLRAKIYRSTGRIKEAEEAEAVAQRVEEHQRR